MSLWGPQIHYVPLGSPRATCQNLNRRCGSIIAPRVWGLSSLNYKLWVPLSAPLSIQHVRPLGPGSWRASKRLSEKSRLIGRNLLRLKELRRFLANLPQCSAWQALTAMDPPFRIASKPAERPD